MSLYRGAGGASDATDDSTVNAVAGYASSAASSASAAAASATTATNNATAAATSASQAASSTSAAATSASNAATSASNAASSASNASSSASSASTSASNAANSAGTASNYAAEALNYRNTASTHATNAANSASAAAGSATSAANSAAAALAIYGDTATMEAAVADAQEAALTAQQESQAASDSALNAADSEDLALEHEQNAAEWATVAQNAANSATAASTSANAAWDQFDDRYLGAKTSDPTVDNDGNALITGALYFNNATSSMKVYTGSAWTDAYATGNGFLVANNNLSDLQSAATARTNLGLGSAALENSTALVHTTGDETIAGTKTFTSTITGSVSGNAGTVTNGVYTTGDQTIGGTKTFSNTISGSIDGNAATVTNGVYTTGDQTIGGTKTFSSTITGSISGNAGTVTNGVYTTGDQTIAGTKTFSSNPTLSAGTANGVAYLNGSKVLTTGSALTFDGTNFATTGALTVGTNNRVQANSGILFVNGPAAVAFENGAGAEQMRLTSTGLGIGTSSPGSKLEVYRTSTDRTTLTRIATINNVSTNNPYTGFGTGLLFKGTDYSNTAQNFGAVDAVIDSFNSTSPPDTSFGAALTFSTGTNGSLTERMRLTSSGNLGLGVTPSAWGASHKALQVNARSAVDGTTNSTYIGYNWYNDGSAKYIASAAAALYEQAGAAHYWYNAASGTAGNAITFTQAMTLDASGNLLVGVTNTLGGTSIANDQVVGSQVLTVQKSNQVKDQNNNYYMQFNGSNGADGYINTNGSAVLVISDASDRRIKENIVDATYGLSTIIALRPVEYSRIGQTQRIKGFIAQEVKEVLPECVTIKDESKQGGFEDMHILEMQTMIPVLVKALQEQQAIIETLTARVAALEAK